VNPSARRTGLIVVAALAALWLASGLAHAHSQLLSSSPADGATLVEPPARVVLTFNEALIPDVDSVSINDGLGNVVSSQSIEPDGAVLSVPWPAGLPAGTYQVAYRVVSGDGHPVVGAINFTIAGTNAAAASTVPTPAAMRTPEEVPVIESATEGEPSNLGLWAAGLTLIAAALAAGVWWRRRRSGE
jgi:methionine-rich copper-binding protein CopC